MEPMRKRNVDKYAPFSADFAAAHVVHRLLIWSCFGREHPETIAALHGLARRIARRLGFANHLPVLAHIRAAIGVALARWGARMVHACLRDPGPRAPTMWR